MRVFNKVFLLRVKKQGLITTVRKGSDKIRYFLRVMRDFRVSSVLKFVRVKLPSFLPNYSKIKNYNVKEVENSIEKEDIEVVDYIADRNKFDEFSKTFNFGIDFYDGKNNPVWTEKVLEHFIAWEMVVRDLKKDDIYVDVAAASSPWVKMLNEKGVKAIGIDLDRSYKFPDDPNYLVMDATKTSFKDGSISGVSLQCAFEMFTGNDDTDLMKELGRILKPEGKAVIVPLYMHDHYCGYTTKDYRFSKRYHDKGAKLYINKSMTGIPFARFYNVEKLKNRVLYTAEKYGLEYKIYVLRNGKEIHEGVYCHFILELIKR
ncbi:MAG TPA: methyltransferase domain-containing protein [bacterium]|nr:methyltransferase domain-containing protein [bacterium]